METKSNKHGFKTPPNYFEQFEDRLFVAIDAEKLPEQSGFKTPDGYFDSLEATVLNGLDSAEKDPKVISLFSKKSLRYVAAIAACAVFIFSVIKINQPQGIDSIDIALIENYINEGSLDLDTEDVLALFDNDGIDNLNFSTTTIDQESLEGYLLESLDDTFLIE